MTSIPDDPFAEYIPEDPNPAPDTIDVFVEDPTVELRSPEPVDDVIVDEIDDYDPDIETRRAAARRSGSGELRLIGDDPGPRLPCSCACGCQALVPVPTTRVSPALAKSLLCSNCALSCEAALTDAALAKYSIAETRRLTNEAELARWWESVPARFRDAATEHPTALDRIKRLRTHGNSRSIGLYVYGATGGGKTWIGYGFLNEVVRQGLIRPSQILHGSETDILGKVAYAPFQDRERMRAELLDPRRLLVMIDDVGWAKYPRVEDQHALWHEFMDHMWANNRHVVITTNHDKDALRDWIGPAAYDRLLDLCGSRRIVVDGDNMRQMLSDQAEDAWRGTAESPENAG